jgi:hypothetical protein
LWVLVQLARWQKKMVEITLALTLARNIVNWQKVSSHVIQIQRRVSNRHHNTAKVC